MLENSAINELKKFAEWCEVKTTDALRQGIELAIENYIKEKQCNISDVGQRYIKFHNVVYKLIKIENGEPIALIESMDSTIKKRQMIECRIAIDGWEYATENEFIEYESRHH
jgi:hypothetical protein